MSERQYACDVRCFSINKFPEKQNNNKKSVANRFNDWFVTIVYRIFLFLTKQETGKYSLSDSAEFEFLQTFHTESILLALLSFILKVFEIDFTRIKRFEFPLIEFASKVCT